MKSLSQPRLALLNLVAAAACAGAGWLCLRLQAPGTPLPVLWLPAGLALSALAIAGRRLLPGVWLGQTAALLPVAGMSWAAAAVVGITETAAVWLGVALLHRLVPRGMTRDSSPVQFVLIAYGCMSLAGLCAPIALRAFGLLPGGSIDAAIIGWWLADALGIVVLVPAVLEVRDALLRRRRVPACTPTLAALALTVAAFGVTTFAAGWTPLGNGALQAALLVPPLLIVTVRCHPAVPYTLGAVLALALAHGAAGPFGMALGSGAAERASAAHSFILVGAACVLFLAAHARSMRSFSASAQAGEERFRSLSALTSDWYWEQDADCRFTRLEGAAVGDAAELQWQFVGKRHEELPGFEPYDDTWRAHDDDLAARRVFRGRILRYVRPDGRISYYSVSGEPVFDSGGEFTGYRGVGRDITPEIKSREALLASEKQFHEIADATFEGLLVQDFGRILFANRACAEMAGCSVDTLIGRSLLDFVAPEEHAAIIRHLASSDPHRNYVTMAVNAKGRRFPLEIFSRPFVFQGKPVRVAAIRDISDRCQTEAALRTQIEFQHTLLDTIPNPVFYKNSEGRYLGYNRAFAEFLGVGLDEYIGRTVLDLMPGEAGRSFAANDEALFGNPGIQSYEQSIETPRGRRDVMVYKDVFRDEKGETAGSVGIFVDVTERKKSEQRLRRFQELSPAAIGIVSTGGQVLYMNPAAGELFGYRLEDVPNMEVWWQVAYPDPAYRAERYAAWIAAVEQTLRDGRNMFRFDGRVHCMDGKERWIETMVSLGEDEIFMIFTDLTDYVGAATPPV